MISKTVVIWLAPTALSLATVAGNVWMSVVYASVLTHAGVLGATAAPLGWLYFFGLLGLNNMVALVVFSRWLVARRREIELQSEIREAISWRTSRTARAAAQREGFPAPAVQVAPPANPLAAHMPYAFLFLATLIVPATILGALALS